MARDIAVDVLPELRIDRDSGLLMLSPSALPDLREVCTIGHALVTESGRDAGKAAGAKKFSRFRIAHHDQRLALLRVGLDHRLVAMVASYLGTLPVITEADFYCSYPVEGPWTKSQLWHCDDDAGHVLKLFVYCDDVDDADGPFELVEPGASQRTRNALGYRYAGRRYRVSDAEMNQHVRPHDVTSLVGPRGTAFAVDTARCFHRGSRIRDKARHRVVGMVCYAPPTGRTLPRRLISRQAPLASFATSFPGKLERAVLGMPIATKWL